MTILVELWRRPNHCADGRQADSSLLTLVDDAGLCSVPRRSSRTYSPEELALGLGGFGDGAPILFMGPTAKTCHTCLLLKVWSERQLSKQHAGFISCCRFRSPSIDSLLRGGVYKLLEILPCSRWKTNPVFFFSFLFGLHDILVELSQDL